MQLRIQKHVLSGLFAHAVRDFPGECCGFLYGHENGQRIIRHFEPAKNAQQGDQRRRFTIDPLDYLRAEQRAEELGTQLLGIYHSHPLHPAIASEHDLAQAMPYFSYVIVSVHGEQVTELRSWRLNDDTRTFHEELVLH
jgi:proteasome lid subunit RPN8/RPN11